MCQYVLLNVTRNRSPTCNDTDFPLAPLVTVVTPPAKVIEGVAKDAEVDVDVAPCVLDGAD